MTNDRARLRVLAMIGFPLAIGFAGGVGALFATLAAREFWHSSLFPIFFLVGALTSGTAMVTAVVAWLWPSRDAAWKDLMTLLGRIVLVLVLIDFILEWAEFRPRHGIRSARFTSSPGMFCLDLTGMCSG